MAHQHFRRMGWATDSPLKCTKQVASQQSVAPTVAAGLEGGPRLAEPPAPEEREGLLHRLDAKGRRAGVRAAVLRACEVIHLHGARPALRSEGAEGLQIKEAAMARTKTKSVFICQECGYRSAGPGPVQGSG